MPVFKIFFLTFFAFPLLIVMSTPLGPVVPFALILNGFVPIRSSFISLIFFTLSRYTGWIGPQTLTPSLSLKILTNMAGSKLSPLASITRPVYSELSRKSGAGIFVSFTITDTKLPTGACMIIM